VRAAVLREFGPPGNLHPEDVPPPPLAPGQALINVEFASITFVETQIRSGHPPVPGMAPQLPAILGNGVGGMVTEVGPGVDPALAGRRFVSTTGGKGGYAEQAAVPAEALIPVPGPVQLADAAALLADGRTATALVRAAAIQPGQTVLIEAAAGGVGTLLIQLARNAGANVIAAASTREKLSLATGLGATQTIDYQDPAWPSQVTSPIDTVFDGVGGQIGTAAFSLLGPGGKFCAYGMSSGTFAQVHADDAARRGITLIRGVQVTPDQIRELTQAALTEAAAGRLHPVIGQRFPLGQAPAPMRPWNPAAPSARPCWSSDQKAPHPMCGYR
jgi:NADPH:quinone reductase